MKQEILDEIENNEDQNRSSVARVFQVSVGSILLIFLVEKTRDILRGNVFDSNGVEMRTIGILIIGAFVLHAILTPEYLNKIKPRISEFQIILYTGLIQFFIGFAYKAIQKYFLLDGMWHIEYVNIIESATIISALGMLVANIRIHKIRKKGIFIPVMLLIVIWIILSYIKY